MRVFFAIEFSKDIKEMLKSAGNKLKENSRSGNFTTEDNLHITVKFIGEIEAKELEKLKKCLDNATANRKAFTIRITRLGEFARDGSKLIWAGIENKDNGLINLYDSIENETEAAGYKREERSFKPHITLGREVKLKEGYNYKELNFQDQDMTVDKVVIMESSRIKGKLTYTPIYNANLL